MKDIKKQAIIQDDFGNETTIDDLFAAVIVDFKEHTKPAKGESLKASSEKRQVKTVKLYVKQHENKAYYVVNDNSIGSIDMFS